MSSNVDPFVPVGRINWDDEAEFTPKGEIKWDEPSLDQSPMALFEEALAREEQETDFTAEEINFLEQQEGGVQAKDLPRGIRNNNPGNIEIGEDWEGMSTDQSDGRFVQFESPEYGIRAMAKILGTYKEKYGLDTIEGVVSRWAPPNENDTEAYINSVVKMSGISRNRRLSDSDLKEVIKAMIRQENGDMPYDEETIARGVELAKANS